MEFKDIRITDFLPARTRPSDKAPGLRHLYLQLSSRPPAEWVEFFEDERKFPRHTMWRHAWIEIDCIVVDAVPEELERHHLADLKQDVAKASERYRALLVQRSAQHEAARTKREGEQNDLSELRKKLKFD